MLGGFGLCPGVGLNDVSNLLHQLGTSLETGGLRRRVGDSVKDADKGLVGHCGPHKVDVSFGGKVNVTLGGRLGLFLESMKDIDGFGPAGVIDDAESAGFIDDTKLFDALPYDRHRLEVVGLSTALEFIELKAGILTNVSRKVT